MRSIEYLDAVKKKLEISSNYGLAKALDLERQLVNAYYRGERVPDSYACTKIAILLGEDPTLVIAEIQAESETNAKKKGFWRDFASHVRKLAAIMLALTFTLSSEPDAMAAIGGKNHETDNRTPHYTKRNALVRVRIALAALFRAWWHSDTYSTEKYAPVSL